MRYELEIIFKEIKPRIEPVLYTDLNFSQYQVQIEKYKKLYMIELEDTDFDESSHIMHVRCYAMPKEGKKHDNRKRR